MSKILVFGWWTTSKNVGDIAISLAIRKAFENHEIYTLPSGMLFRREPIKKSKLYLDCFRKADLVLMSGGTPLYDYAHFIRTFKMSMPKILNKPFVLFGVGTKPIYSSLGKFLIPKLVSKADSISVRDPLTKEILSRMGVDRDIKLTGDSAFLLDKCSNKRINEIMKNEGIEKGFVAVCPRRLSLNYKSHYHQKLEEKEIRDIRNRFTEMVRKEEDKKVILPFHREGYDSDLKETKDMNLNNLKILECEYNPSEILGLISKSKKLIGSRLHSLIFAYMMDVGFETVNYDIKIKGFLELIKKFSKKEIIRNIRNFKCSVEKLL